MLKKLFEQRAELQTQLEAVLSKAKTEERAMNADETAEFDRIEGEIRAIDTTIKAEERARAIGNTPTPATNEPTQAEIEERAFSDYVMGKVMEMRAGEQNFTMGSNGAIIPTTIANKIIKAVKDRCPILAGATIYNVKGTLKVPVYGKANTTHDIAVGYQSEFTDITADAGKFTSVDLGGYLIGALTLIGRSVENNGSFSVVDFVVNQMADELATFLEKEALTGSGNSACQGALSTSNTLNAGSVSAITADNLIDLQAKVKSAYQANACWTMHPSTFTALRKLKDGNGQYLLQSNFSQNFPYAILGKPVYISDNMPEIESAAKAILYGDYSGLSANFRENISIEVLREKYATQHAIGVVAWCELDTKVTDSQKLATLVMSV
jgi:HK97 family phage major capsid protein